MGYTLELTLKATHLNITNQGLEFKCISDRIKDANCRGEYLSELRGVWHESFWRNKELKEKAMIRLARPHNETKEYWTTNGVTKYAQPITTPRAHAAMAAEFMSDDRVECETRVNGEWHKDSSPSWLTKCEYRLIHPKTEEEELLSDFENAIHDAIGTHNQENWSVMEDIASELISNFNITRK